MSVGVIRQNARGILTSNSTSLRTLVNSDIDGYSSDEETHFVCQSTNKKSNSQNSGALVQNRKKARVYVFGNGAQFEDDEIDTSESTEMCELRSRGYLRKTEIAPKEKEVYIEKEISDGDTLQNLSLQYGCPVAELKRINNLITDQDFFALKFLKVPIKRHGLLSDLINQDQELKSTFRPKKDTSEDNGACWNNSSNLFYDENNLCSDEHHPLLIRSISIGMTCNDQSKEAQEFLKHMDKDLERIRNSTKTFDPNDDIEAHKSRKSIHPMQKFDQKMHVNGWDCGVSWRSLVITVICVGIVFPSVYFLYFRFHKSPD